MVTHPLGSWETIELIHHFVSDIYWLFIRRAFSLRLFTLAKIVLYVWIAFSIVSLVLCHWAILVLIPIHPQTLLLKCHFYRAVWSMTLPAIYWTLSELTSLLNKYDALNQIIKCLNQIISENKPYNLRLCTFTKFNFKRKIWKSTFSIANRPTCPDFVI